MPTKSRVPKITRVAIREIFPREVSDLTPWIEENVDALDDLLGLGLSNPRSEQRIGSFQVDLIMDSNEGSIVIENQFGKSDHRHLGQLITYLAIADTQRAIWIAEHPRPEHVQAVETLNERGVGEVWFLKIEGLRILESPGAPFFSVVAEPDDIQRPPQPTSRRNIRIQEFWEALLENAVANKVDIPHKNRSPAAYPCLDTPAIGQDVVYRLAVNQTTARIVCSNRQNRHLAVYDHLESHRREIDRVFERADFDPPSWKDNRDRGRWWLKCEVGAGYLDNSVWEEEMPKLNQAAVLMKQALDSHLATAPGDDEEEDE